MNANVSIKLTLSADMAEAMRTKVEAGEYASEEEMLKAGLQSLIDRDHALDRWLHQEVVAGHAEFLADPSLAIDADDVLTHLRDRRDRGRANG